MLLPDKPVVRKFFRRELDELAEHREVFGVGSGLAVFVAFTRMLDSDEFQRSELFAVKETLHDDEFIIQAVPQRIEVGWDKEEDLIIRGFALGRVLPIRRTKVAVGVGSPNEKGVELVINVDRRHEDRLPAIVEWFHELVARHNPYKGAALSLTEDGNIRFLPPQGVSREEIILPETIFKLIERDFGFLEDLEAYPPRLRSRSLILAGEPGLGKTLLCRWMAERYPVTTLWVTPGAVKGVGPTVIMEIARSLRPTLAILEDLDVASGDRRGGPLGDLLSQLDGFTSMEGVAVVATTNHPEVLDEALDPRKRPGRFHRFITLDRPDATLRQKLAGLLVNRSEQLAAGGETLVDRLAEAGSGMTAAQLCELVADLELEVIDARRRGAETVDPVALLKGLVEDHSTSAGFGFRTAAA